jgi:hypothetical protein
MHARRWDIAEPIRDGSIPYEAVRSGVCEERQPSSSSTRIGDRGLTFGSDTNVKNQGLGAIWSTLYSYVLLVVSLTIILRLEGGTFI